MMEQIISTVEIVRNKDRGRERREIDMIEFEEIH